MSARNLNKIPLSANHFVMAQTVERYCKEMATSIGKLGSVYLYNRENVLIRHTEVDRSVQKFVPA